MFAQPRVIFVIIFLTNTNITILPHTFGINNTIVMVYLTLKQYRRYSKKKSELF